MRIFVSILFMWAWLVLTVPICFSIIFLVLRPILIKDTTGIGVIVLATVIGIASGIVGTKLLNRKIKPFLFRDKT